MADDAASTRNFRTIAGTPPRARRFRVRVRVGPDAGREIEVEAGTAIVGSHRNAELYLTDKRISRYHLELRPGVDGLCITDLGSTNGSFVGEARLGTITANESVQVRLGSTTILEVTPLEVVAPVEPYLQERFGAAIGASQAMRQLFSLLAQVAPSEATVLLEGEGGTGKELLAEAIHAHSSRRDGPFVVVDCAALPKDLMGLLRQADGGTVVFDEIGELPLELQSPLLRVLEKREVRPVGEVKSTKVDIRIIAATNRTLADEVRRGEFREELYFRLAVVRAAVPPLRQHREDIPFLASNFLRALGRPDFAISTDMLALLMAYEWPGNVRELRNVIERGASLQSELPLLPGALDVGSATNDPEVPSAITSVPADPVLAMQFKEAKERLIDRFEREYLTYLLERNGGNLSRAAVDACVDRNYIRRLLRKHGMSAK
jgi:DNA-binding NtrC family response regulator